MMPGESRSQAAEVAADAVTAGSASCLNCDTLQQNLNEYVTALIALKQKIIDTDHVLTEYQKKCDELQKTERDCKTLRDQLDELLQKFAPLEKCKEEMDAMRIELEEKRSSVKMYQQTHLEFNELQQEQTKNDALKKKLESRIKRLEETTTKQNTEIKQLRKEKTTLERNLKKTQEKLMVQQKNGIKVLKDAQTQNATQEVPTAIDKSEDDVLTVIVPTDKVKVLLEEIWLCIEKSNVQEKPNKRNTYSPGKRGPSQKKCKTLRSSLLNPSHSSPLETSELPTSSPSHQLECDQEENNLSKMDESLTDEGLKSNSDSAFYDDKTVELTRQNDPIDTSSTDSDGGGDDDGEQDALSRQLQEILDWTEPLPPQLSPLPCSPSTKKQILFGDITDSSDDDGGSNLPGRSCHESVPETDQLDSSGCTEVLITDQPSTVEAGISASMIGELSAEKMDCSEAETEDLNEQCLTTVEVEDELSDPCLIAEDDQCRNENSTEAHSLFEETVRNSVPRTPEMYNVDSLLALKAVHEKNLTPPQYNYNDGMQRDDITEGSKNTVVSIVSNLKAVEPELERSKPCNKEEYGISTCVKEVDKVELELQDASTCGQLGTTFEAMEVVEIHCNNFTCDSQKDECTTASVLPSDMEHTKVESTTKEQISTRVMEELIPLSQLNRIVVHGVAQDKSDECIPTGDMEMEEINCNSATSDGQKGECTQISLQPVGVELPQAESLMKEQNLNKMEEITPPAEVYCSMETGVSQEMSKNCISTGCTEMEEINSGSSILDNQKDKFIQTSVPASDFQQTHTAFETVKHSRLDTIQEITPLDDFNCAVETSISQDKSKNFVCTEDTEMAKINSASLISDNQKDKCTLTSVSASDFEQTHTALVAVKQSGLDKRQEVMALDDFDCPVETSISQNKSKNFVCTEMAKINSASLISDNQKDKFIQTSVPASDFQQTHTAFETVKHSRFDTIQEITPLDVFNCPVETSISQDKSKNFVCTEDTEMAKINSASLISDNQKDKCTLTSVPASDFEQTHTALVAVKQSGLDKRQEVTSLDDFDCPVETSISQNKSKNFLCTEDTEMAKINSASLISDNQKDKCMLTSVPASDFEQTHTALVAVKQSGLNKMQEVTPLDDFDCPVETSISQDKSKNFVCTDDTEMEEINSGSSICDNRKDKCTLTSMLSNDIEEFAAKEQNGLGKTDNSVTIDVAKDRSRDCVRTGGVKINDVDAKSSTFDSPNNEIAVPSKQEFIQQTQSDLLIKKGSLNELQEVSSLKSDCSMVADVSQDSFNDNRDMEMEEVDSDRAKDECISTLVPFHIQLAEGESTTKGQDCLSKMEQASPFVEFDGSVIPGVIQGKCKDYISTQDVEVEEVSCNECTLILVQSSTEESQTKSTIKEHGIITKTKEACSFLESDCSFVATDLDQVKSTEYTSTVQMSNKSTRAESTGDTEKVKLTVCGSPVDKWNEGNNKLMENEEKEKSDIEEIINGNVRLSGECLSSDQIGTQFEINTYSTQSSSPCVLQYSVGQENFMNVGQNKAADTLNNNVVESEENANSEKNEAMSLKSRKLGNELQLSLQEPSTTSTQIYQMNENPQNSEAEVSMLVRKIKRKQWHRKILTPERETQDAINHKMVEMEITAEACIAENLNHELKVHTGNHKQETEHHSLSVNGHVTVQCADLPFDSKSVSESKETVCNIESITNAEEESVTVHPDCIETQPELVTLDEDFSQDTCQTPVFRANQDTNMNFEDAGENGDNTMSVKCKALDLDTPALKICDDEPLPKLSPNIDMLGCMQIENNHLVENNYLQNETEVVEKSKSTSEDCSNLDSNFCIKEQFGIRVNKNAIGIAEEMPNCIPSVKKVNNSTNTPIEETSSHISLVQKVDSSTQTELTYNGLQTVLYTSSDLLAAPKSLPQMDIVEGKVGMPKAKKHSSYCDLWNPSLPDVPSDHQRPIHTVALGGKEVLFESTVSNPVDMESFGTSECEQTSKKTAKNKKSQVCKSLPRALIEEDGDVQQDSSLQKSNIQSTYKSHVVLRRNRRGSNANDPPVLANTDTSAPVLCTQEIHQVMLEMGQPLPPLLLPLVATPPRTARATRPISPLITTSSVASLCSPVDDLASPSKETSKAASVSPPLDHTQQKSPSMHSPSPLEFARNERIQSSPLQFCTATPKHAVPVPGRLPQSASTTGGSALPQENSVKILDAMYPNLSARARTLNILRGNVQLSIRGPADGENQAGAVNQIMGFKAINSAATAFVKAGSNSRSEGTKTDGHTKDLEHQQPAVDGTSSTVDRPKKDHVAAKRSAEDNGAGNAKRVKTENNCQQRNNIADFITPQESSTVNVIDTTKSLYSGLVEQKTGCKTEPEHFPQPLEPINSSEEAVATALMKITKSCFDLLPVVRSHVFVGNIPQMPVLRDEEKEVICELSGNKDLTEALLMAIIKKLKAEQTTLDGNRLQALSRVYVAICRQQGDLERARLLSYSILKEDFPDSSKLLLHILSVWQNIFSMQGPVNKAMQAVAKQRAKGDVLNCLSAYLNWEKNPPLDVSSLVSSFLIAMQQSPKVRFQTSNEYGMDFNGDMWELIYAIDLLCSQQQWTWTHNCFIRNEVWPVMDKWMKRRKGQKNVLHIQDATVAGVMRLIGRLGQQGLKKESVAAVRNMAAVINKFLQQAFQEGVPWPVQLSAVYAVYDLAPSNPKGALEALHTWKASVTEPIPSEASSCLMELETLCERLNSEIKKP